MSQRAKVLSSEGKSIGAAADCRLGSSWWKHSLHVFVIRGKKKKKKVERKSRSGRGGMEKKEEKKRRRCGGGRGGQMCLQLRSKASG